MDLPGIAEPWCALVSSDRIIRQPPCSNSVWDVVRRQPPKCTTWTSQDPSATPARCSSSPRPARCAVDQKPTRRDTSRRRNSVGTFHAPGFAARVIRQVLYRTARINENSAGDRVFFRNPAGFRRKFGSGRQDVAGGAVSPRQGVISSLGDVTANAFSTCRALHQREETSSIW